MSTDKRLSGEIRSEAEAKRQGLTETQIWLAKIEKAKADPARVKWFKSAKRAVEAYEGLTEDADIQLHGANIFHSGIETIAPSVYNSTPIPDIRVRFDERNKAAKMVADMFERVAQFDIDQCDFDDVMLDGVRKSQTTGDGLCRIRYDAKTDAEVVKLDNVWPEIVPWDRIIFGPARSFAMLPWLAFEHDMTEEEVRALDEEAADRLQFGDGTSRIYGRQMKEQNVEPEKALRGILSTIKVYEIWDKRKRQVWWITPEDNEREIKIHPDALKLAGFFPIPKPLRPKGKADSILPLVAYEMGNKLYREFEDVSNRISALVRQLQVKGIYDARLKADLAALKQSTDGEFTPAQGADVFTQGGQKFADSILFWPIETIIAVLKELNVHRDIIKALIWESSGVSDIMRGASDPDETLGAQELKAQYGSMRLRYFQMNAGIYARDVIRLMIEVRANLTPWDRLKEISAMDFRAKPERVQEIAQQLVQQAQAQMQQQAPQMGANGGPQMPPPVNMEAIQAQAQKMADEEAAKLEAEAQHIAKNSHNRTLSIDIETDSTIRADISRDMEQFNQLITSAGTFAGAVAQLGPILPATVEPLFKVFASQVRKFRLGREGEEALDELGERAKQPPQNPAAPAPEQLAAEKEAADRQAQMEQQKAENEKRKTDADLQLKGADLEIKKFDLQSRREMAQIDMEAKRVDAQTKQQVAHVTLETKREDANIKRETAHAGLQAKHAEIGMKQEAMQSDIALKREQGQQDIALKAQQGDMDLTQRQQQSEMDMADREAEREHTEASRESDLAHQQSMAKLKEKSAAKPKPTNGASR